MGRQTRTALAVATAMGLAAFTGLAAEAAGPVVLFDSPAGREALNSAVGTAYITETTRGR